jgi:hypothetical protein
LSPAIGREPDCEADPDGASDAAIDEALAGLCRLGRKVAPDRPGIYVTCAEGLSVSETSQMGSRLIATKVPVRTEVEVIEVLTMPEQDRVRAKIKHPEGWISLSSPSDGFRWAMRKDGDALE